MSKKLLFLCLPLAISLIGCVSQKKNKNITGSDKYRRTPIVEVPEQRLQLDVLSIDAKLQKELGYNEKAKSLYLDILKKDSTYMVAWFDLGELYFMQGDFDKAVECTQKAVKFNPENVWYRLQLAEIYRNTFRLKDAAKEYEQIVKIYPDELSYYYEWANALLLSGNGEGAIKVYNLVEKKIGINETLSSQKQAVWRSLGRRDKVIEEAEKLWKQNPDEIRYNAILAELHMGQKNYSKAQKYYENIKKLDPNNQFIDISMAEFYKATGEHEKAYKSLKQAFGRSDMSVDTKFQILISFYTLDEFYNVHKKYSFDLLDNLYQQDSSNVRLQPIYGDIMFRNKKFPEAFAAFNKTLQRDSSQYELFEIALVSLSYLDNKEQMLELSEKAIRLFPSQPLPYYFKGVTLYELKKYEPAEQVLQRGMRWIADDKDMSVSYYSILAECYHNMGNIEQCFNYYDKTLELDPENIMVLNNYAYYLSLRKENLQKAASMSKKTLEKYPDNTTYMDTYAWVMFQMGNYKEALVLMEQVLKLEKDPDAVILEHYADVLYKNNQIEKARNYWKQAAEKGEGSDKLKEKAETGIWTE